MSESERPKVSFVHDEARPFVDVKSQRQGDRRVSVWLKMLDLQPDRAFFHTRYDPDLVLQRHGHMSDHYIFIISGTVAFDGELCRAGSLVKLPCGGTFGPIVVGDEGAELIEVYFGDSRPVPVAPEEWAAIKRERGITELPNPTLDVPEWFGERTD
ncbi:hypothetical protein K2X89_08750 [Myxococcota bacterium]|nr:hypothetical protein [Myxococcota bacterium]